MIPKPSLNFICQLLLLCALISGCHRNPERLRIGCKNFTEQLILAEIVAQTIQKFAPEIPIEKKWGFGSTMLIHQALAHGDIDLYLEYSGTAEQLILKSGQKLSLSEIDQRYQQQFSAQWLPSLGFSNGYIFIVRADSSLPARLSEFKSLAPTLKAGLNAEYVNRPDGFPLIKNAYKMTFHSIVNLDLGLLYPALESRQVDLICGFSTDAKLDSPNYRAIEDDLAVAPRYEPSPVLRTETLKKYPKLEAILKSLSGRLTESSMRRLNAEVEINHHSPKDVAREWIDRLNFYPQ